MNVYEHMLSLLRRYHGNADGDRLAAEMLVEGSSVLADFVELRVGAPWVWSKAMEDFYSQSDAFVYELLVWHHRPQRIAWRKHVAELLSGLLPAGGRVACLGDGIGYDSLSVAALVRSAEVKSFEPSGFSSAFAARLFEDSALSNLSIATHARELSAGEYDVVLCFHVLEHVPSPESMISDIAGYLKPGGHAVIGEAFEVVDPNHPTHLLSNLRYAGRTISLFHRQGLGFERMLPNWLYLFRKGYASRMSELGVRSRFALNGVLARARFNRAYASGVDLEQFLPRVEGNPASASQEKEAARWPIGNTL